MEVPRAPNALDYISKHGPIKVAEFKKIWAEIDGDTKKVRSAHSFIHHLSFIISDSASRHSRRQRKQQRSQNLKKLQQHWYVLYFSCHYETLIYLVSIFHFLGT